MKNLEGRQILVFLKNGRKYSGKVIEVSKMENGICWIIIIDKYKNRVTFCNTEISTMEEVDNV